MKPPKNLRYAAHRTFPVKKQRAEPPTPRAGYRTIDLTPKDNLLYAGIDFNPRGAARHPEVAVVRFAINLEGHLKFITERGIALTGKAPLWAYEQAVTLVIAGSRKLIQIDKMNRTIRIYRPEDLPTAA